MGDRTSIEWTEATWNPVTGCTKVSPGCDHCYAETIAHRFAGTPAYPHGFATTLRPERLAQPITWRRPRRIFVCSMADLFHDAVPDEYIAQVFAVMALAPQHTFQVLTKRHGRLRALLTDDCRCGGGHAPSVHFRSKMAWAVSKANSNRPAGLPDDAERRAYSAPWPLPNVWVGVSTENQQWADIRIPALLDTPAAVRWISAEPLLGPLDLGPYLTWPDGGPLDEPAIDWVVAGGESGRGARPMHPDWARGLRDQCEAADVAFLFKQHGEWAPVGPLYDQDDEVDADDARMEAVHMDVVERRRIVELERDGTVVEGYQPTDPRTWLMAALGKKAAGRELDGRTHDGYPAPVSA